VLVFLLAFFVGIFLLTDGVLSFIAVGVERIFFWGTFFGVYFFLLCFVLPGTHPAPPKCVGERPFFKADGGDSASIRWCGACAYLSDFVALQRLQRKGLKKGVLAIVGSV